MPGIWDLLNSSGAGNMPPPGMQSAQLGDDTFNKSPTDWAKLFAQAGAPTQPDVPSETPAPFAPAIVTAQAAQLHGGSAPRAPGAHAGMPIDQGGAATQELLNQLGAAHTQSMEKQGSMLDQLRDQMSELKNKKLPINFQPLAQLVDSWTGSNMSSAAAPAETQQTRDAQIQALQGALMKGQQGLSQDELGFLKDKLTAQYHADDIKQRGIDNAMKREDQAIARDTLKQGKMDRFDQTQLTGYQNKLNSDKTFADATSHLKEVGQTRALLDDALTNPVAANAVKLSMARLYVPSRLNETEIASFGGSKAIGDTLAQIAKQAESGTITQENHDFLARLVDAQETHSKAAQQRQLNYHASQYAHNSSHTLDESKQLLGGDLYQPLSDEDKAAVTWAKANSKDPRAKKILDMHPGE